MNESNLRRSIFLGCAVLLAVFFTPCAKGDSETESPTYQVQHQKGEIRVTLLKVARITSFGPTDKEGRSRLVPGIVVTFAVEDLSVGPLRRFGIGGVQCFIAGSQVQTNKGVIGGGIGVTMPWSTKDPETGIERPEVTSEKRSRIRRQYVRGIALNHEHVDIHIKTGFGDLHTFKFENVPLNNGGR